jgi:glucose/arabinose dehydrogenase
MRIRFLERFSRRQLALGGAAAGVAVLVLAGAAVALVGGGEDEEQLVDSCLEPSPVGEECETPDASLTATPDKSRTPSPSPSPTKSPKPTPTTIVALPTDPPTAAPTPVPVTAPPAPAGPSKDAYRLTQLASDAYLGSIGAVIEFAMIPGASNAGIVASQNGKIYKVSLNGGSPPQLWGDLSGKVTVQGEQGLLSVAFSPNFASNGKVFAYYTKKGGGAPGILARYSANTGGMNVGSEQVLLTVEDFAANHNGGHIAFDSNGYLYLSLGDGGGAGDPEENGQDLTSLLGKVLRLNVSGNGGYTIPPGNPFNDGSGPIREEIFAYGFRNPWRMTVDPQTNAVWLGDVGQNTWEEVNQVAIGGNYGWDCYEGAHSYEPAGCPRSGFRGPRHEYDHSLGQAVTGGVVYRGGAMPELRGWYVFGDFYTGRIWAVNTSGSGGSVQLLRAPMLISSFTLLPGGEIAVVTYESGVYRLAR